MAFVPLMIRISEFYPIIMKPVITWQLKCAYLFAVLEDIPILDLNGNASVIVGMLQRKASNGPGPINAMIDVLEIQIKYAVVQKLWMSGPHHRDILMVSVSMIFPDTVKFWTISPWPAWKILLLQAVESFVKEKVFDSK